MMKIFIAIGLLTVASFAGAVENDLLQEESPRLLQRPVGVVYFLRLISAPNVQSPETSNEILQENYLPSEVEISPLIIALAPKAPFEEQELSEEIKNDTRHKRSPGGYGKGGSGYGGGGNGCSVCGGGGGGGGYPIGGGSGGHGGGGGSSGSWSTASASSGSYGGSGGG